MREWNPRYTAYAREAGLTEQEMAARDEERYPGGRMCGFILWMAARWREWKREVGFPRGGILGEEDHRAVDAWLAGRTT